MKIRVIAPVLLAILGVLSAIHPAAAAPVHIDDCRESNNPFLELNWSTEGDAESDVERVRRLDRVCPTRYMETEGYRVPINWESRGEGFTNCRWKDGSGQFRCWRVGYLIDAKVDSDTAAADPKDDLSAEWRADQPVAALLKTLPSRYGLSRDFDTCAAARGPLSGDDMHTLLDGAEVAYRQYSTIKTARIGTSAIENDRLCLENRAECYELFYCASKGGPVFVYDPPFGKVVEILSVKRDAAPGPTGVISDYAEASAPYTVKDRSSGCMLRTSWKEATSIKWTGGCTDGFISGNGRLRWYKGAEILWIADIGEGTPLLLRDKRLALNFDLGIAKFELSSCDRSYRRVEVTLDVANAGGFIEDPWTRDKLLTLAADFAHAQCPRDDRYSNISVGVRESGKSRSVLSARNYDADKLTWREYDAPSARAVANIIDAENRRVRDELRQRAAETRQATLEKRLKADMAAASTNVEELISSHRGDPETLASALESHLVETIALLEAGFNLAWPATTEFGTTTYNGKQYYAAMIGAVSEYEDIRSRYGQEKGFNWSDFMEMARNPFGGTIRVTCLFSGVGDIPQQPRDVRVKLLAFDNTSGRTALQLTCQ